MTRFLPDLPEALIEAQLRRSPGCEIHSARFDSPESSAALAANAFGRFLLHPGDLPPLRGVPAGRADAVELEAEMRFPWSGGRHPWLDVAISTPTTLIGVETRRYEPFRPPRNTGFADLRDRPVWGDAMGRYTQAQRDLVDGSLAYQALDAVHLIKQAYGLRTRAHKRASGAVLVYLYAEPDRWASGKPVDPALKALHRREVTDFARRIAGDQVAFVALKWADVIGGWAAMPGLLSHATALSARFGKLG